MSKAKRFTSTGLWDEDWFIEMPSEYQLFWFYVKDKCNHAGIFKPNKKVFEVMAGVTIDLNQALQYINTGKDRIKVLESKNWLLIDFFSFQYGEKFNINNKVHKSILGIYESEGVDINKIRGIKSSNMEENNYQDVGNFKF